MSKMLRNENLFSSRRTLLKAALLLPVAAAVLPRTAGATGIPKGTVIKLRANASTNGFKLDNDGHGGEWVNVYGVEHKGTAITGEVKIQLTWSGSRKEKAQSIRLDSKGNGESREYEHETGETIIGANVWCP